MSRNPFDAFPLPPPGKWMGSPFEALVKLAIRESGKLNHHWVGPDHLLLAMLTAEENGTEPDGILSKAGLKASVVQSGIVQEFAREKNGQPFSFPTSTMLILERAQLRAIQFGSSSTSWEHILLALLEYWQENDFPDYLLKIGFTWNVAADALGKRNPNYAEILTARRK